MKVLTHRKCRGCGIVKPVGDFYTYASTGKLKPICKSCDKARIDKAAEMLKDPDVLHTYFKYNKNGYLTNKIYRKRCKKGARSAMKKLSKDGHKLVTFFGRTTSESRIIWTMHHGPVPENYYIYHKNEILTDNRIENLYLKPRGEIESEMFYTEIP